jgi:methionine salvage enolase-phosphatase E1
MKLHTLFLSCFLVLTNISLAQFVQSKSYSTMLKALLSHNAKEMGAKDAKGDSLAVFLDAREKKEFDVSHLKNAVWVGYDDFDLSRVKAISKDNCLLLRRLSK